VLVDTDEPTRRVLCHRLARAGFDVTEETTGPDALAAHRASPVDVVVAGARLPGLDGLGLFRELGEAGAPPPVVLLFWPGNPRAIAAALDAGVADVLVRPLALDEVIARIARLVRS